jgi:hypothetical protein
VKARSSARRAIARVIARVIAVGIAALLVVNQPAEAQSGALFLLVPFGARAVGMGDAVAADTALGAEGIWWNAAALARVASKEVAFHHSQTFLANSEMLTLVFPSRVIGTIAVAGYFVDYGDVQATDEFGNPTGVVSNRSYLLSASYATPLGKRASLGLTYKYFTQRFNDCSGFCSGLAVAAGSSSALDVGVQYALPTKIPLSVGMSVRNLGPKLQVKDEPQADPLPRVIQVGASSRLPIASLTAAGATLDVNVDVISAPAPGGTSFGVGSSLGYRDQYFLRGGYKRQQGDASGPSLGIGFQRGSFGFDFSRRFDRNSTQVGETPTYVTLRARF